MTLLPLILLDPGFLGVVCILLGIGVLLGDRIASPRLNPLWYGWTQPWAALHERQGKNRMAAAVSFEGYCTKCRSKRQITGGEVFNTRNGKEAQRGVCPVCSTRVVRMGSPKS